QSFAIPPSSAQRKVAPGTLAAKLKVASGLAEGSGGAATMDVSIDVGGAAFTAQRYSAGGPLPTLGSTARTANTCSCSDRPWYSAGDVQAAGAAPSREHSKVAPAWSEVNSKVASGLSEGFGGSLVIVATGATATVQLRVSRPLAT